MCTTAKDGLSAQTRGLDSHLSREDQTHLNQLNILLNIGMALTIDKLEEITTLWYRASVGQGTDSRRLATFYEARPDLLKQPFAPQRIRQNVRHVPQQLRSRTRRLESTTPSWYNRRGNLLILPEQLSRSHTIRLDPTLLRRTAGAKES